MRALNRLPSNALTSLPEGKHEDGGGLRLVKTSPSAGLWVYRCSRLGRRREMGLGPIPAVTLKVAREEATEWRARVAQGFDPIAERDKERSSRLGARLKDVAQDAFVGRQTELKEGGKAGRWFSPLEHHVLPKLGEVPIAQITQQSGTWRGKAHISGGRKPLRDALYMPALVAMRFNPDLKRKYQALRAAGPPQNSLWSPLSASSS